MGMFDTIKFRNPFSCEKCNAEIPKTQTKCFGNTLSEFAEGDFLNGGGVITGVTEEDLYCPSCNHHGRKIYIAIWHSLYVGSYDNYYEAERRITSMEKADLLDYILFQQKRYVRTARRYNEFYGIIRQFSEYIEDKEKFFNEKGILSIFHNRLKEYIDGDDEKETLKRLLEVFKPDEALPDDVLL